MEATYCGCIPLAPNKLVYPEMYPNEYLYNTKRQLIKTLSYWCRNKIHFKTEFDKFYKQMSFEAYSTKYLIDLYLKKIME